jgi:hypothetical protein
MRALIALLGVAACANRAADDTQVDAASPQDTDPLAGLPAGQQQHDILCARANGDPVALAFCATTAQPSIGSLVELQRLLGLDIKPGQVLNGQGGNPAFALTAHSTSLAIRSTSQINPRVLLFTPPMPGANIRPTTPIPNPAYVAMGYVRGEQFVELASKGPDGQLRFYLFAFHQACNAIGCAPADLFLPEAETGFIDYTVYEDRDLANTQFDCLECHQPDGPGTPRILRMQELQFPWTHWISNSAASDARGNNTLRNDFVATHDPSESYAGIPCPILGTTDRSALGANLIEAVVENNGFMAQPNEFQDKTILDEVVASNPAQPQSNIPPGVSPTWNALYASYISGAAAIPPPYHDERTTDPTKLATAIAAYRSVATGATPRDQLPDIRDVFLDAALPDMTIRPSPGQTGRQILIQMCRQCHNSRLDQTLSRARFDVDQLDAMTRDEKDLAITRIQLPTTSARHMPPLRLRELEPVDIDLVTQELAR